MGAANVKAAYVAARRLGDQPVRLLTFMAVTAKDNDPTPLFWDGQDSMALALGEVIPDEYEACASAEARRRRESALRKVRRALQPLIDKGLVTCVERAAPGRRAVYALHLMPPTADTYCPPSEPVTADTHCPPSPVHNPVDEVVENPDGGHLVSAVSDPNGGHLLSADAPDGGHLVSATADTYCPPKDLDLKIKIKSRAPAHTPAHTREAPDDPLLEELVDAIAVEQGWFRDDATKVVTRILDEATTPPRAPLAYVRDRLRRHPTRYRPNPGPARLNGRRSPDPAPCRICAGARYEADVINDDPRCGDCAQAGRPVPDVDPAAERAAARRKIAAARQARAS